MNEILIPNTLKEYVEKSLSPIRSRDQKWVDYAGGWIYGVAEDEYRYLARRESEKENVGSQTARLLCELAVAYALLKWHEEKDKPPPMPDLRRIDNLLS